MLEPATQVRPQGRLPDLAIESVARGFFREADRYGFEQVDYLRFVNAVLGLSMSAASGAAGESAPRSPQPAVTAVKRNGDAAAPRSSNGHAPEPCSLPLADDVVRVRAFDPASDTHVFGEWMRDDSSAEFLRAGTMMRRRSLDEIVDAPDNILALVTLPDGTPIGATAFLDIDPVQSKAEMRKLIGEPALRGRGYGRAATRLWLDFGLHGLRLHKIYINTLNTNLRNIQLNEGLGFRLEGILHDEVYLEGRYHDVLRMAVWGD